MRFIWLSLFMILSGCAGTGLDAEQVRLCRLALPALYPQGTDIRPIREAPGTAPDSVTIDYRVLEPDRAARVARTNCVFTGSAFDAGRFELVSLATDGVPLSDIKLYILKRWWLEEPGVAGRSAPDAEAGLAGVALLSAPAAYALQQLVNAIPLCAVYALLAVAYSLIYGLTGRIVLAFGEIAVFGSYGVLLGLGMALSLGLALPSLVLLAGLGAGMALAAGLGALTGRAVVGPLGRRPGNAMIVATLGLAIAIQEFLRLTQGADDKWLTPLGGRPVFLAASPEGFVAAVTPMQLLVALIATSCSLWTLKFMRYSRFGRNWRAVADDPPAAALLGVDSAGVLRRTMALSGALAGVAGWILLVHYGGIGFSNGLSIGLKALVAAVLGGMGSIGGALLGGIIVGLAETFWSGYFNLAWRDVVILVALALVLACRPGGLLGFADRVPRRI